MFAICLPQKRSSQEKNTPFCSTTKNNNKKTYFQLRALPVTCSTGQMDDNVHVYRTKDAVQVQVSAESVHFCLLLRRLLPQICTTVILQ